MLSDHTGNLSARHDRRCREGWPLCSDGLQHFKSVDGMYLAALDEVTWRSIFVLICKNSLYSSLMDCDRVVEAAMPGV